MCVGKVLLPSSRHIFHFVAGDENVGKSINNDEKWRGQKFGRLTIIGFEKVRKSWGGTTSYAWNWICRCDCGTIVSVPPNLIKNGQSTSCGCRKREVTVEYNKAAKTKHGKRHTKLYSAWRGMRARCYTITDKNYPHWGGRGITMCDEWRDDFMAFYNWAIENGWEEGLTLDRIDVNGNYEPNNCRWSDWKTQARNRTTSVYFEIDGVTKSLVEWAEDYDIPYGTVYQRITKYGWDIKRALTQKRRKGDYHGGSGVDHHKKT